jgi:RNA polymerase sigma-70 factor (ECF subfamily)
MTGDLDSDERLMARVAAGDRPALDLLVRRHAAPLFSFLRRLVRDHHRCEELFQETFLSVWSKRHLYEAPRSFKAWLYAIALNKCRAAFRSRPLLTLASPPEEADGPLLEPDDSPGDRLLADETAQLVLRAVEQLPPQQRLVVMLRVWQGLSYAEIAETLGRTEATVRSHMHHALQALRMGLEAHLAD